MGQCKNSSRRPPLIVRIKKLEEKLAYTEARVEELEKVVKEIELKLRPANNLSSGCDDEDRVIEVNEAEIGFPCNLCEFRSSWKNGLTVHDGRKHKNIEQLDGIIEADEGEDEPYLNTESYWRQGLLGRSFQNYIDAIKILEDSSLDNESKEIEKVAILDARKDAFGDDHKYYPPWR